MATSRPASSDDTASEQYTEKPHDVSATEPTDAPAAEQNTEVDKTAPLDRTPSQAARMGKKKIIAVMTALCVRITRLLSHALQAVILNCKKLIWRWRIIVGPVLGCSRYGKW